MGWRVGPQGSAEGSNSCGGQATIARSATSTHCALARGGERHTRRTPSSKKHAKIATVGRADEIVASQLLFVIPTLIRSTAPVHLAAGRALPMGYWVLGFAGLSAIVFVVVILYRRARYTVEVMTASVTLSANSLRYHVAIEPKLPFGEAMESVILGVWYSGHMLWLMGSRAGDRAPHDHLLDLLEEILKLDDANPTQILRISGLDADLSPSSPPPPFNRIKLAMRAPRAMPVLLTRELVVRFGVQTPEVHLVASVFLLLSFVRSQVDTETAKVLWAALRTLAMAERQGAVSRSYSDKDRVCYAALSEACEQTGRALSSQAFPR